MSVNKKRKSDVNVDSGGVANPKKEKWYDEEQKAKMLAAPIEPTGPGTGRRSSFLGAIGALKRMVSGSTLKDKSNSRSTTKITPAAQLTNAANAATFSSKENDSSFASVNSHESDNRVNLANSVGIRTFVLTGEIPKALPADSATSDYISNEDPFDAPTGVDNMLTDSSSSVFSMVTPSRNFRRDTVRRSSVRSMPECTNTMIESLALTGVRRHASVSASDQVGSPVSRPSRYSFRLWRSKPSSMADLPENAELNTSFAPLAEIEETNTVTPLPEKRSSNLVRTASRLFSSGNKKRTTIANPNEILSISMNADGGNEEFSTPKNPANFKIPSPSSSGLQKRVSNAFNILRFKSTPSPGRGNRVQRSKTENPKTDHRIRKKTDNPRRSTLPCGGLANSSFVDTYREDNQKEKKAMADMFRLYVSCSDTPIPEILESSEFDAIIIDVLGGKPFGTAAAEIVAFFNAAEDVQKACLLDADKMEAIFKRDGAPALVCIKGDSQMMKDVGARVRTGVGCGLREVWKEDKKNRVLAYPTFVSEEEGSDVDKCLGQFFVMVHNALGPDWGFNPDNCERIVLAGVSDDHAALMKEHFDIFVSKLPSHDT